MKELSIEEKARAYDGAIETARKINSGEGVEAPPDWTICEVIFPELKESEDERIRKELLEHCINRRDGKQVCVDASDYRRWADWLFRQGVENIPNVKSDKEISNEIIKFLELPHPQFVGKRHQEDWIAWLEKQSSNNIKWNKNTKDNKPRINRSVLMQTTHGIAEGEWQGELWYQYRWSTIIRDSDVLSWIELSDIEKQGEQKPIPPIWVL